MKILHRVIFLLLFKVKLQLVENLGTEVYSHVVIPGPHEDLRKIIDRYSLSVLLPEETIE